MSFFNKAKWIMGILLVFFIVLMTNLVDRSNFSKLSASVTTLYEDRLVAYDLLYDISTLIREQEMQRATNDQASSASSNERISALLTSYKQTKLTSAEQRLLQDLERELESLGKSNAQNDPYATVKATYQNIYSDLEQLTNIQLQEGRNQVFISDKAMSTINLFTKGEMIFLIITAVLLQIIILYKPM